MEDLAFNISFMTYGLSTLAYTFLLGLIILSDQRSEGWKWLASALMVSIVWGVLNSISSAAGAYTTNSLFLFLSNLISMADWLKASLWIIFLFSHLSRIWELQENQNVRKIITYFITSVLFIGFAIELMYVAKLWGYFDFDFGSEMSLYVKFILAFVILTLIENLYRNIANENRWGIRLFCLALGSIYAFDFLIFGDAIFYSIVDDNLTQARGAVNFIVSPLMAIALLRKPNWSVGISLSRKAVFHIAFLVAGLIYLIVISTLGYFLKNYAGEWGTILQISFLFASLVGFLAVIYSGKIRSIVLVILNKYFFTYKFDYREEWLRYIGTMTASKDHYNLSERAIKAIAEMMDCQGGALWYLEQPDTYQKVAQWNFKYEIDEELPVQNDFSKYLENNNWIANLDEINLGKIPNTDCVVPSWLQNKSELWLVVPLIHRQKMTGFVVLYGPRVIRELNWETIDVLKTVSLQTASYLAEQEGLKALAIAQEFEEFNRKFAFVIHDIKNMASQLSLLHKNAEKHGDNPAFQKDMRLTVRNTVDKMNDLLSRINKVQEPGITSGNAKVNITDVLSNVIDKFIKSGQDINFKVETVAIFAHSNHEELETVFMHIIQNALDACKDSKINSVDVSLVVEDKYVIIKVEDFGVGMSKEFIRDELFRPFRSLKESGYGIGAYESRQLIHKMTGRIEVKSKIDIGTVVSIYLKKE